MSQSNWDKRFAGVSRVIGTPSSQYFRQSHICVVGLGGVGSWAVEALVRSGLEHITLVDGDDICISNSNRQLPASSDNIGRLKTEVLKARMLQINPDLNCEIESNFLLPAQTQNFVEKPFDLIIDAIDHIPTKAALIASARRIKKRIVCSGGAGGLRNPMAICVKDLSRTTQDPLLSAVRKLLRQDYGFPQNPQRRFAVPCVYSEEQAVFPDGKGGVVSKRQVDQSSMKMDCSSGFGALMPVTATFGMMLASLAMEKIIQRNAS